MFKKLGLALPLAFLGLVTWQSIAGAELYRMRFQINTFQRPATANPAKLVNVNIQVSDSLQRPYDAVQSLTVSPPQGDPAVMTENWNESAQAYTLGVPVSSDTAPAGTYTATVVGKDNSTITQTVKIDGKFLDLPVITAPPPGTQVGSLTPTISWNPVAGAQYYNLSISGPQGSVTYQLYRTSFTMPPGVLKSGSGYTANISAFDSDKLTTKMSQAWVSFTTPTTP